MGCQPDIGAISTVFGAAITVPVGLRGDGDILALISQISFGRLQQQLSYYYLWHLDARLIAVTGIWIATAAQG